MKPETLTITYELDEASWDAFVNGCPDATAYHLQTWRRVLGKSFGHPSYYLAALDAEGTPQSVLPLLHMKSALFGNFLISIPFVNYGGLLSRSESAEELLLREAERLRRFLAARYVELRQLRRRLPRLPSSDRKVTMLLPLAGTEEGQWAGFGPKLRNQIRKGQKSGLTCAVGGAELLDGFYQVFARNMRDLGTPVYSIAFFRNVLGELPQSSRILAVKQGGTIIAAAVAIRDRGTVEIPWASSITDFRSLCPNNLLYWEAIRYAISQRLLVLDFRRSTVGGGTYNFKKQWGAQPVQLSWQYLIEEGEALPELNPKNPRYRLAIRAWKRLPVALSKVIGPRIVRNIP